MKIHEIWSTNSPRRVNNVAIERLPIPMSQLLRSLQLFLSTLRLIPHLLILLARRRSQNDLLWKDLARWTSLILQKDRPPRVGDFLVLMTWKLEFRNLFYYRTGWVARLFAPLAPTLPTLYLKTKNIGPGLVLQHGFSTILTAHSIGENCWVNQQVTVGYTDKGGSPRIGNNVSIGAGAKVLGDIVIGDNVRIGANAVVVKSVPPNCTVVGVPASIVKRDGKPVKEDL